jgi:hypothetical protein
MRVSYFLAILGETLQQMNNPATRYSIAVPDLARRSPKRKPTISEIHSMNLCVKLPLET